MKKVFAGAVGSKGSGRFSWVFLKKEIVWVFLNRDTFVGNWKEGYFIGIYKW